MPRTLPASGWPPEQVLSALDASLYASAPCWPHGMYDPIEAIGDIALRHDLWLHVDACLGSRQMLEYMARFANTGDPNGAGAVSWPAFVTGQHAHLELAPAVGPSANLEQEDCEFWDAHRL